MADTWFLSGGPRHGDWLAVPGGAKRVDLTGLDTEGLPADYAAWADSPLEVPIRRGHYLRFTDDNGHWVGIWQGWDNGAL